jgi:hypothetical protein
MILNEFRRIITSTDDATIHNFKYSNGEFFMGSPQEEYYIVLSPTNEHDYENPQELEKFWNDPIFNGKSITEIIGEVEYLGDER